MKKNQALLVRMTSKQKDLLAEYSHQNKITASEILRNYIDTLKVESKIVVNYQGKELQLNRLEVESVLKSLGKDLQAIIDQKRK